MKQLGGFLGRFLGSLLKAGFSLMKNIVKPLAKIFLIPLGLTAAASVADGREINRASEGVGKSWL